MKFRLHQENVGHVEMLLKEGSWCFNERQTLGIMVHSGHVVHIDIRRWLSDWIVP